MNLNFRQLQPTGKCPICGINCWAETQNIPAIWPCGLDKCPYPVQPSRTFARSATGSSLSQIVYSGG
jgi:hypothetical protein